MDTQKQIDAYIDRQPEPKRGDMRALHDLILKIRPGCRLWFLDGRDSEGRIVSNPNAGYGGYTIRYADGNAREFYQVGMSANTTGISLYIMGIEDRTYLASTFGPTLGKASMSGYCIKFRKLSDVNIDTLAAAMRYGLELSN